jgi:hypothetical protein
MVRTSDVRPARHLLMRLCLQLHHSPSTSRHTHPNLQRQLHLHLLAAHLWLQLPALLQHLQHVPMSLDPSVRWKLVT